MKILTIGNSFSADATRYLHQIAKSDNYDLTVVNLYIGGCTLYTHYKNMLEDSKAYAMEFNGESTGFLVSIKDALLANNWDYVSLQQASWDSVDYETYQPYMHELVKYVKKYCPKSKLIIHQTWAYEQGSSMLEGHKYDDCMDMFADAQKAYQEAVKDECADIMIPSGELVRRLIATGVKGMYRDGFHMSYGLGRYALALLWYGMLSGNGVLENKFADFDEPVSCEDAETVRKFVTEML